MSPRRNIRIANAICIILLKSSVKQFLLECLCMFHLNCCRHMTDVLAKADENSGESIIIRLRLIVMELS